MWKFAGSSPQHIRGALLCMFLFKGVAPPKGSLAQRTERLVTSQDVAGSSPARPTEHGSASCFRGVRPVWRLLRWRGVTLFGLRAS